MVSANPSDVVGRKTGVQAVRAGSTEPSNLDFDLPAADDADDLWDLVGEGDLTIPDDVSNLTELPTDGNAFVSLIAESREGTPQTFSATFQFLKDDGTVGATIGPTEDAALDDTYVFANVSVASKAMKIVLSDTSGAGSNDISGSVHIHP